MKRRRTRRRRGGRGKGRGHLQITSGECTDQRCVAMATDTLAVGEQINWCEFLQFITRKCLNWISLLVAPEAFNVRVFHFWSAALNHAVAACYVRRHARQRSCQGALNAKWDMGFHGKWITSKFLFGFMKLDRIFGGDDSLIEQKESGIALCTLFWLRGICYDTWLSAHGEGLHAPNLSFSLTAGKSIGDPWKPY